MAKVIGFEEKVYKKFTCGDCGAIVQYTPKEDQFTDITDEGCRICGLNCPNCGEFHRTNP
jgi:transcription initiation factor IIE alpha subunit